MHSKAREGKAMLWFPSKRVFIVRGRIDDSYFIHVVEPPSTTVEFITTKNKNKFKKELERIYSEYEVLF